MAPPSDGPAHAKVFVYYRGPQMWHSYTRHPQPMDARLRRRLDMSIVAHVRQTIIHRATDEPPVLREGEDIDLCRIEFPLDINLDTTRREFGLMLQDLAPPVPPSMSGGWGRRLYTVSEWDILCPRCGLTIRHFCTDKFWNERYILHLREEVCRYVALEQALAQDEWVVDYLDL